jgi:aryl-alcohol dehydrogenase-like predicted oxidoreductase
VKILFEITFFMEEVGSMNDQLKTRRLGQTDIEVTPIGLGVMQFAGGAGVFRAMFDGLSQSEMNAIVGAALEGGINWFDTAEMYGRGRSERALATGLNAAGRQDNGVVVCTKWFPILRTAGNIARTIDVRLHHLDGYKIDHYIVHQPWGFSSTEAEMNAMADLVEAGKIRSVGVSNFNVDQMCRAHKALAERGIKLATNQVQYSLLERGIERSGVLQVAKDLGVSIVSWGPLASGLLTGKFHKDPQSLARTPAGRRMRLSRHIERAKPVIDALDEISQRYNVTIAQVALNWLVNFNGETVLAIPGASKVHQAQEAAGAMQFKLDEAHMAQLDEVSRTA